MDQNNSVPQSGQTEEPKKEVPPTSESGQTQQTIEDAHSQSVPDNFKGKSSEDLVKMYGDLSQKLGSQRMELGELRKFRDDMAWVLKAIQADPNLTSTVEKKMSEIAGIPGKKEEKKSAEPDRVRDSINEVRFAEENRIMREFEGRYGLDQLDNEQKAQVYSRLGNELKIMTDPKGVKNTNQVLDEIDLRYLPEMLERAYFLAHRDETISKAMEEGRRKVQANLSGAIGGIQSSGSSQNKETMSLDEKEAARRFNMSDEDWIKYKNTVTQPN